VNWILAVLTLSIQPWAGHAPATTTSAAVKYRLEVAGKPNEAVHLRATGVAQGWLGAFCTPQYCSPERADATLPASGRAVFTFELIRESDSAPKKSGALISGTGGVSVTVSPAVTR
jgi:hypothetical protein